VDGDIEALAPRLHLHLPSGEGDAARRGGVIRRGLLRPVAAELLQVTAGVAGGNLGAVGGHRQGAGAPGAAFFTVKPRKRKPAFSSSCLTSRSSPYFMPGKTSRRFLRSIASRLRMKGLPVMKAGKWRFMPPRALTPVSVASTMRVSRMSRKSSSRLRAAMPKMLERSFS